MCIERLKENVDRMKCELIEEAGQTVTVLRFYRKCRVTRACHGQIKNKRAREAEMHHQCQNSAVQDGVVQIKVRQ